MIYFASDVHLGLDYNGISALERERRFVKWLKLIEKDCEELFLVGDIFDYWFEYRHVVPKGFSRTLGQLSNMSDNGVQIHFFAGNHDFWLGDYFKEEFNAKVYFVPTHFHLQGKHFLVSHGDGLGKVDVPGRILTVILRSRRVRWLFQNIMHPDLSMWLGKSWSTHNRSSRGNVTHSFRGYDEPIVRWVEGEVRRDTTIDFIVLGHLHTPTSIKIGSVAELFILGEWIENPVYGQLVNGELSLHTF